MEKRNFGRTNLAVTVLGYGAMELRSLAEPEANRLLNSVLDQGINYIDTSPDYGPSEELIGKTIAHRRDEYFLASKCGCNIDIAGKGQTPGHIFNRHQLVWNIENSLRLLKTDHLDVWQLHGTLPEELPGGGEDDAIKTMQQLKKQGKVRWIGVSFKNGGSADPLYPAGYTHKYFDFMQSLGVFDMMQMVYGGLVRLNETIIKRAAEGGLGVVVRGVVKNYAPDFPERFVKAGLAELCEPGESMSQFLLRFAMNQAGMSTTIIGTKNAGHLAENIQAAERGKLSESVYAEAVKRLDAAGFKADGL
jgi:aryl-alcohol dehydrogenase-like predicted oxidoreductase